MELTYIISFISLIGLAYSLEVGPVQLVDQKRYISYALGPTPNNSVIECPITLSSGEELEKVSWELLHKEDRVGTYEWTPAEGGVADGLLSNIVKLDREDGYLELTSLRYDLNGNYSCSATTTDQVTVAAAEWEVVIIDTTSRIFSTSVDYRGCKANATLRFYAVFPEPTVSAGLYSDELGSYVAEATLDQWLKVKYANGSVAYSLESVIFEIDENTPLDTHLSASIGVTKDDGTYVGLAGVKSFDSNLAEPGCSPVEVDEHQQVRYSSDRMTCRGTHLPGVFGPLKATVACAEGYIPDGNVSRVIFECDEDTWSWTPEEEEQIVQNLQCIENPDKDGGEDGVQAVSGNIVMLIGGLLMSITLLRW